LTKFRKPPALPVWLSIPGHQGYPFEVIMAQKLDEKETVTLEELAISNSFEIMAMFNILAKKGLITSAELEEELIRLKTEH
jgi:hypothetical protein